MHWVFQQSLSADNSYGAPSSATTVSSSFPDYTQHNQADSSSSGESHRFKTSNADHPSPALSSSCSSSSPIGGGSLALLTEFTSVFPVHSQELFHLLVAFAEAAEENNFVLGVFLFNQIRSSANSQAGAVSKIAVLFANALSFKMFRIGPPSSWYCSMRLEYQLYEECPYVRLAHSTANQAILEAFAGKTRVHIIDFSIRQGTQWLALMQAFALRPGGPPKFQLTGIGPRVSSDFDHLQEVGWKLAQVAETLGIEFEYRGFVAQSLDDLDANMLELRPTEFESIAVNSIFELHKLLGKPGAIDKVLSMVKQMKPEIFTIAEQEADTNDPIFLNRFINCLHYYLAMFESLEGSTITQDERTSDLYFGLQIRDILAYEEWNRIETYEKLTGWRARLGSAGFEPIHTGSNALKEARTLLCLLAGDNSKGYTLEEKNGCLMVGWNNLPLIATSAWRPGI